MLDPGGGTGGVSPSVGVTAQNQAQAAATRPDPKVEEAVQTTLRFTEHLGDPAYAMQQTLSDTSLSQAQKDEYVARVTELAGANANVCTAAGSVTTEQSQKLVDAFERIGVAYTDPATPELRSQVSDAIARGVDSGRLDADDVYGLVDPSRNAVSDGARQLLSGVHDGATLNRVADRLLTEAQHQGYDINKYERGPETLTAAADIANMAADHGWTASANAVALEIDAQTAKGPVSGDMTLVQAMMATTVSGNAYGNPPEGRTGFDALAGLVNSARSNDPAVGKATDTLFGTLVRSREDGAVGGIDQYGDNAAPLGELGTYFNANASRLIEADWRKANTGGPENGLVRDFMREVMLEPDYKGRDATAATVSDEMRRLSGTIDNGALPLADRQTAASSLGTLLGSVQEASRSYVADAKGDAEDKIDLVRNFSDLVTDKLLAKGPPIVGDVGGKLVDAAWGALADRAEAGAKARADDATGGLTTTAQDFRNGMSELDPSLLTAFDLRVELYFDPSAE
ncbi:hypothetical protein AB2M62_14980 [Sphingomonas sp. MMS12-HWE2-04]|uniref:hypothetical protein n=1 Tax=Sphingomonas sp. MMS12-HWE2-04 TaxID=3234199 RepID=UPI00384C7051